jgi:hypothetical protein
MPFLSAQLSSACPLTSSVDGNSRPSERNMRRDTAITILLVVVSASIGLWLGQAWGFNPTRFSEQIGLSSAMTIGLLFAGILAVLVIGIVQGEDAPALAVSGHRRPAPVPGPQPPRIRPKAPPVSEDRPMLPPRTTAPPAPPRAPAPVSTTSRTHSIPRTHRDHSEETNAEDLEVPQPDEIDPSGEWPKPTGPFQRAEDVK